MSQQAPRDIAQADGEVDRMDGAVAGRVTASRRRMVVAVVAAIGLVALTMAIGILVFVRSQPTPPPTPARDMAGVVVPMGVASHVALPGLLEVTPGLPPAGGPHFEQARAAGVYARPIADGNAIHSLEHGMVWISYAPDTVGAGDLAALRDVAARHVADVILSPRLDNAGIAVVSWGRRLTLESPVSTDVLEAFVVRNVDQSSEPGIR